MGRTQSVEAVTQFDLDARLLGSVESAVREDLMTLFFVCIAVVLVAVVLAITRWLPPPGSHRAVAQTRLDRAFVPLNPGVARGDGVMAGPTRRGTGGVGPATFEGTVQ